MKELNEIRFNETDIQLQDNLVRGSILPEKMSELNAVFCTVEEHGEVAYFTYES